jgi:hypothetical protein
MSIKVAQQTEDVPFIEEDEKKALTADELLSFITHKLLAELVRIDWKKPIASNDHETFMKFIGHLKLDDGRTVKQVLNAGIKRRSDPNKKAVYRAWGALADMIREGGFVSFGEEKEQYTIEAAVDDKKWKVFGKGKTLVEATVNAAEEWELITKAEVKEIQGGFEEYPHTK